MLKEEDFTDHGGIKRWVNSEADIPVQRIRMLNLTAAFAERSSFDLFRLIAAIAFLWQTIPTDKELNQ